jgi:molybdopterin synthase catalytic subunit
MSKYLHSGAITSERIGEEIKNLALRKDTGGHSIFLGQVREDLFEGKRVKEIEYSAHEGMLDEEAEKIKIKTRSEFCDVLEIVIIHSVGVVKTGEISMFVMVSARHRDHAIKACRQTVELVKEYLPVWKKEIFQDDSHKWRDNT